MMHGAKFKGRLFADNIRRSPVRFLYRGKYMYVRMYVMPCELLSSSCYINHCVKLTAVCIHSEDNLHGFSNIN